MSDRALRAAKRAAQADNGVRTSAQKRKLRSEESEVKSKRRRQVSKLAEAALASETSPSSANAVSSSDAPKEIDFRLLPAVLTFSFEDAKQHLINIDSRFEDLFSKMVCRPFQHLETVHPFRALVTSILGQQISWLAARSINHRFRRLFDPSLPEKPTAGSHRSVTSSFPTPQEVANTDIATLRTAGLSARKAEYVQDLASRFADGRLSTKKLIEADDEELGRMLIEVRGIGRWTVDMFAIFSLRRPDILPVGDLGVQRGIVRWFLSLHSPAHSYSVSPEKVGGQSSPTPKGQGKTKASISPEHEDVLPVYQGQAKSADSLEGPPVSSVPPAELQENPGSDGLPCMPPPFTPSIRKTMNKRGLQSTSQLVPLPDGLDVGVLKSRLDGKKKIKGAFLTPKEMEDLTACWRPYRSIGVYYMWSLAEITGA